MALVCNVFEMLYQLANLDESRYTYTLFIITTKKDLCVYQGFKVSFTIVMVLSILFFNLNFLFPPTSLKKIC